jgi:hypothetical protein
MIKYENTFIFFDLGTAFPTLAAINESPPGTNNGTEFIKAMVDDEWSRTQAVIWHAYHIFAGGGNDARNGFPEGLYEAGDSQHMESLAKAYAIGPGSIIWYAKSGDPVVNEDRVLILDGSGIDRTLLVDSLLVYDLLDQAVYVGDSENPTAPAFYHADDAAGTIRNTAGDYLILPNAEGRFVRSVDTTGSVDPEANRKIGDLQDDAVQTHAHYNGAASFSTLESIETYGDTTADMGSPLANNGADVFGSPFIQGWTSGIKDYPGLGPFPAILSNSDVETRAANIAFRLAIVY